MSEFTKDELELLYTWGMSIANSFPDVFNEKDKDLYNKLSLMVSNYCEHEEKHKEWLAYQCDKCGRIFHHDNQ